MAASQAAHEGSIPFTRFLLPVTKKKRHLDRLEAVQKFIEVRQGVSQIRDSLRLNLRKNSLPEEKIKLAFETR
jgi:hypothetical protein